MIRMMSLYIPLNLNHNQIINVAKHHPNSATRLGSPLLLQIHHSPKEADQLLQKGIRLIVFYLRIPLCPSQLIIVHPGHHRHPKEEGLLLLPQNDRVQLRHVNHQYC